MKSLRFRILLIFTLAIVAASFAAWKISGYVTSRMSRDFFPGLVGQQLDYTRKAFEEGGVPALKLSLSEMDQVMPGSHYLLDARGRDLLSGVDRSETLKRGATPPAHSHTVNGMDSLIATSTDGKYHFVAVVPSHPPDQMHFFPYFVLLAIAIVILVWLLSVIIVSPVHRITVAVERFGNGDLKARVRPQRNDEIGNLGRSFDSMADHIETLLAAERRLLQDVSHELRSPLARLSFAAELIKNAGDPDEALGRVRREIVRLSELIDNLLVVTNLEGNPSYRKTQRFSFTSLVREVIADCAFEAATRNVAITGEIGDGLEMEGNPELMRRALENVLRNAIRYSPNKSCISAAVKRNSTGIAVTISDAGPGVPEELLSQIFVPFVRVDQSRDSASGGVGLGLSIARRAVIHHHGEISASNLDPGLQIQITLPTKDENVAI